MCVYVGLYSRIHNHIHRSAYTHKCRLPTKQCYRKVIVIFVVWVTQFVYCAGEYLEVQVSKIKEISDYITVLRKVGPGQGEYLFDKETLQAKYK